MLNRITTLDAQIADPNALLVSDGMLYFLDQQQRLLVTDGTSTGTLQLSEHVAGEGMQAGSADLVALDGMVYFIRDEAGSQQASQADYRLWKTDGTPAGTQRALDVNLPALESSNGMRELGGRLLLLAAPDVDPDSTSIDLVVTDGTPSGSFRINAVRPELSNACQINEDVFYYVDNSPDSNPNTRLFRVGGGQVEPVVLTSSSQRFKRFTNSFSLAGDCVFLTRDEDSGRTVLLALDAGSEYRLLDVPNAHADLTDDRLLSYAIEERLYFTRSTDGFAGVPGARPSSSWLHEYLPGAQELFRHDLKAIAGLEIPGFIASLDVTNNFFYLGVGSDVATGSFPMGVLTSELEFVRNLSTSLASAQREVTLPPRSVSVGMVVDAGGEDWYFTLASQRLVRLDGEEIELLLRSHDKRISNIVSLTGAAGKLRQLVLASELDANRFALYELATTATISERLAGMWTNAELERSAVIINSALGADNKSRFLSISVLTYLDGVPFWLFGAAPMPDGLQQLDFDLNYTTGPGFLGSNPVGATTLIAAGTARLSTISCDQIEVRLQLSPTADDTASEQDIELDLSRLLDTASSSLCID
ncbi:MAG: hypothetical protein KKC01_09025 [Gammaproteobacteria bacterium]|nr:hypothetical protein [Gammaproteobacteria bacterium]